eukprot:5212990-Amphidinium_carterae.1
MCEILKGVWERAAFCECRDHSEDLRSCLEDCWMEKLSSSDEEGFSRLSSGLRLRTGGVGLLLRLPRERGRRGLGESRYTLPQKHYRAKLSWRRTKTGRRRARR